MRIQIESQGYSVDCIQDGAEAIRRLQVAPPDLVILGLMMPEISGFDVLAVMRRHEAVAHTPVIILTAKTPTEEKQMFLQQHMAQVIGKRGFECEDFLGNVQAAIQNVDSHSVQNK